MIQNDLMMPESDPSRASAAGLGRKLDRLVASSRGLCLLDLVGRIVVAAAVGGAIVTLASRAGLPLPTPAVPVVIGTVIVAAALVAARRWRWPDRLSTAMEIERAYPWMGERISRAVGLATATPESGEAVPPDRLLAGKAVAEAIAVLDGRPSARTVDRLAAVRWPLAGLVTVGLFAFSIRALDRDHERRPIGPTATEGASVQNVRQALSDAGLAAARRLADNAAAEERLAIALLGTFAAAPGLRQDELSRQEREWLDATAVHHASIVDEMESDLLVVARELVESRKMMEDMADPLFLALVGERYGDRTRRLRDAAEPLRSNRLAAAGQSILRDVKAMLAALESLGARPSPGIGEGIADWPTDRAGLVRRRLMSMIDAHAAHDEFRADGEGRPADRSARGPAARVESSPPAESGTLVSRQPGASAGAPAGEAASARGERSGNEPSPGPVAGDGGTPAWMRARETRPPETLVGDGLGIAGRYRAAVDGYYRRLWATESHDGVEREGKGTR